MNENTISVDGWRLSTEPDEKGRICAVKRPGGAYRSTFGYGGDIGRGSGESTWFFMEPVEVVKVKLRLIDRENELAEECARADFYERETKRLRELIARRIDTRIANWFKRNLGRREYED